MHWPPWQTRFKSRGADIGSGERCWTGQVRSAPSAACRCGRRLCAEESGWPLGPVDDDACSARRQQHGDFASWVDHRRHDRRAGQRHPGTTRRTGAALLIGRLGDLDGVSDFVRLRCARSIQRCCVLASVARHTRVRSSVARMPVRCMRPRRRLQRVGQCLDLRLCALHAMMGWPAMHHGGGRHSLRGHGERHKPNQHDPEQLPHRCTLQQLP